MDSVYPAQNYVIKTTGVHSINHSNALAELVLPTPLLAMPPSKRTLPYSVETQQFVLTDHVSLTSPNATTPTDVQKNCHWSALQEFAWIQISLLAALQLAHLKPQSNVWTDCVSSHFQIAKFPFHLVRTNVSTTSTPFNLETSCHVPTEDASPLQINADQFTNVKATNSDAEMDLADLF